MPEKATELKETGAEVLQLDVTKDDEIAALAKSLENRTIDILINNAGYKGLEKNREDLVKSFDVNAASPFLVSEALIPNLELSKKPMIINISSQQAQLEGGTAPMNGYSISKTALNMVTRSFHCTLFGERVYSGLHRARLEPHRHGWKGGAFGA